MYFISFSVAIKCDQDKMRAPTVFVKGADLSALEISKLAESYGVPISKEHYLVMSQGLVYLSHLKKVTTVEAKKGVNLCDLPIPEDMRYDINGKRSEEGA